VAPEGYPGAVPMGYPGGYPGAVAPEGYPGAVPAGYPEGYPGATPAGYPAGYPGAAPAGYPPAYPGTAPAGYPGMAPAGYPEGYPGVAPSAYPGAGASGYPGAYPTAPYPGEFPQTAPGAPGGTGYTNPGTAPYGPGAQYGQIPYGYPQMDGPAVMGMETGAPGHGVQGLPVGTGAMDCGCGAPEAAAVPPNFVPPTPPIYSAPYTGVNTAQPPFMNPYGMGPGAGPYGMPRYVDESNEHNG